MMGFKGGLIERAELSSKIYNNLGLTTVNKFNHMVLINMISKCTISVADVRNADIIYGPLMASLNGKSTVSKTRPVIKGDIYIPSKILKKIKY